MKHEKWQAFVSLGWYDGLIEFLFRFVAKTSEPLLALGLVISAADYLTKGALMRNNETLTLAWAWTSAIAIEASSGVVFVYALQSFKDKDKVKGYVYLALSLLLLLTGASMLYLQLNANTTNSASISEVPLWVMYLINTLRVVVSVAYVYLCRAKHIRFSDLVDTREQAETPAPIVSPDVLNVLIERLDHLTVSVTQLASTPAPQLPEHAENRPEIYEPIYPARFESKEQEVAAILARSPGATPEQVAQEAGCNVRTAEKWIKRLQKVGE